MDRLPQELVIDILSRLPIPSLTQSKSVCRAWLILLKDQVLLNKHFKRMVDKYDPSFVLQIRDQPIQNQLYFGDFSNDHVNAMMITKKISMPPLMLNFHLVSSCNGLLCLRATRPSFKLCIYNPFTKDYIELPKLITKHPHVRVLGFGFDPTSNKYKVVVVSYKRIYRALPSSTHAVRYPSSSIEYSVHILTVGSSTPTWRNLGIYPFNFIWQKSQVLVNGKLHWISYHPRSNDYLIMSIDLADEQFKEVPRPDFIDSDKQFHEFVALRGCLSMVSFDEDIEKLEIWVMKEYGVKESWVKQFSIGPYVPKMLQPNKRESLNNSMFYSPRVLCMLRSGGIVLDYRNKELVYDPHCRTFHDLQVTFEGIPRCFEAVVHVASLSWIDTFVNT